MGILGPVPVGADISGGLGLEFGASIEGLEREAVIGKREGGGLGFQKMAIVMSRTSD